MPSKNNGRVWRHSICPITVPISIIVRIFCQITRVKKREGEGQLYSYQHTHYRNIYEYETHCMFWS